MGSHELVYSVFLPDFSGFFSSGLVWGLGFCMYCCVGFLLFATSHAGVYWVKDLLSHVLGLGWVIQFCVSLGRSI